MKKLPIVALIGQTNAGKSSLLNRMAHRNIAIVAREEGTTRDNVMATIDGRFILIDTAGLKDPEDDFEESIQDQIQDAIELADLILFVVDSTKYPDFRDKDIAKQALRSRKPVMLLLNKSDVGGALPEEEFLALGVKEILRTSATTGAGIKELKDDIITILFRDAPSRPSLRGSVARRSPRRFTTPEKEGDNAIYGSAMPSKNNLESPHLDFTTPVKLALIGRPNVGKSSLFNSLGKKQQALVSSRQGTTRDVNRVSVKYNKREIEILDTAGLRKPGKREVGIEKFSAIRTLAAIEEADVCALLVDATEPHAKLDQALAGQIVEAGKGIIVVVTKIDLLRAKELASSSSRPSSPSSRVDGAIAPQQGPQSDEDANSNSPQSAISELLNNLERDFDFLPYAPVLLTSSETGKNVTKLFELTLEVEEARHTETQTATLNKILREAMAAHPPAGLKNTHPKPKYIVQTDTCPPWFVIHGREMELMHWSYKRYLERKIREVYPMIGTPIRFSFHNDKKSK